MVDRSFKSFFGLLELVKAGEYDSARVRIPKYLDKEGYFMLIIPQAKIESELSFYIPMTPAFKKQYGRIKLQVPDRLRGKEIKEIRIHPKYNARFFEIEDVYEQEKEPFSLNPKLALAIDLGLDNLAACVDTDGASFLIDGKYIKSINHWYNKEIARLQSIKDKQGIKGFTTSQSRISINRNNRIDDYLSKASRYIINHCIRHKIGELIVGTNSGWKQGINLGSKNNQNFVQIPHWLFKRKLKGLCDRYGIKYTEQEESYTSKASFLDGDEIPVYDPENPQEHKFSGKRVKRGQYRTSNGTIINADCNGAANILRKSKHKLQLEDVCKGLLFFPLRVNPLKNPQPL